MPDMSERVNEVHDRCRAVSTALVRLTCAMALLVGCGDPAMGDDAASDIVTVTAPNAPDAVIAYRDGDGMWTTTMGATSPIVFAVTSGTYTVAIVCAKQTPEVYNLTVGELRTLVYDRECRPTGATLSGTVSGLMNRGMQVTWGQEPGDFASGDAPSYSFMTPLGTRDLVATRGRAVTDRVIILRDIEVSADASINLDFEGPTSIPLEYPRISALGGGRFSSVGNTLVTGGGTSLSLGVGAENVSVVPGASMGPDDLQVLSAGGQGGVGTTVSVFGTSRATRVAVTTLQMPPPIAEIPVVSLIPAGAFVLPRVSWSPQPGAALYRINVAGSRMYVSPAVFDATGEVSAPDMSNVSGWDATLGLPHGLRYSWSVSVVTIAPLEDALRSLPFREVEIRTSGWVGDVQ